MTTTVRTIEASPQQVWDVLADGWLYPLWVVGATRMRAVEDAWPKEGSRIHHSAGVWPLIVNDETVVLAAEPPTLLRLRARGWPLGEADVTIALAPDGAHTRVSIDEDAVEGPGALVPKLVRGPGIAWRNTETLRRLAFLVEGRSAR